MSVAIVTGSGGLIGSEAVRFLTGEFEKVIGIDNDMRAYFFGEEASTNWNVGQLQKTYSNYEHRSIDIRNFDELERLFKPLIKEIKIVVHTAAQPSHDWAAREPLTDFGVNATGTINLLELTKIYAPEATFIFTSTNKVYGDTPNRLPLVELPKRWEIKKEHIYFENGIDESMSIDYSTHSVFGASKVAADIMCQEYGRYFGLKTGIFRGGCLTGPQHSGAQLHGFLAYLLKCNLTQTPYTIFGYKGKQVRDNIHSKDLISMFWHFHQNPRPGEVYNAGGGRYSNCSMIEAIEAIQEISGIEMNYSYTDDNRVGDHVWYISDLSKFKSHYPDWNHNYSLDDILKEMHANMKNRYSK
jgi:CDP-paratose 2-epimerase